MIILSSALTRRCVFFTSPASRHTIVRIDAIFVKSASKRKKRSIALSLSDEVPINE